MAYRIKRMSDSVVAIKVPHWWSDSLSVKAMAAALTEVSETDRVVSVCKVGGWTTRYLIVVEKR